jgi:uncharacterized protein (TIRG00374 family)
MRKRRTGSLLKLATLAVTAAFSYFALSGVHPSRAWSALAASDVAWLVPAVLVFVLSMAARAIRWRSLFAPGRRPPLSTVANAMTIGYLYNNILPARAGELARVLVLNRRSTAGTVEIAGTAVLERLYDVVGILAIFLLAVPWLPHVSWLAPAAYVAGALAAGIGASAFVLARHGERAVRSVLAPLRRLPGISEERLGRLAGEVTHGLSGLRHPGVALLGLLWTIVAWLLTALLAYLVSLALHLQLPLASGVLVTAAIGLAMILPAPPASVGVFEGAVLIGLKAYGVPQSAGLPFALVLHLLNFLPFVLAGAWLLHYNSRHPAPGVSSARPTPTPGYAPRFSARDRPPAASPSGGELATAQAEAVQLQAGKGEERLGPVYDRRLHADG